MRRTDEECELVQYISSPRRRAVVIVCGLGGLILGGLVLIRYLKLSN